MLKLAFSSARNELIVLKAPCRQGHTTMMSDRRFEYAMTTHCVFRRLACRKAPKGTHRLDWLSLCGTRVRLTCSVMLKVRCLSASTIRAVKLCASQRSFKCSCNNHTISRNSTSLKHTNNLVRRVSLRPNTRFGSSRGRNEIAKVQLQSDVIVRCE